MKKKLGFVTVLLIGVISILGIFYYISDFENFPEVTALYISIVTAIYCILSELNPNKAKKQELYGQLKKSILVIISRLEGKYYQDIHFRLWKNIRQDDRYHLFDKELRGQLDGFLEKIKKYSAAIIELDSNIIPEIIDDAIVTVFNVERSSFDRIIIFVHLALKNRPRFQTSISELGYYLKKNQSLIEVIHQKAKVNSIEAEEIESIQMLIPLSTYDVTDENKITKFWDISLRIVKNVRKYKFVVEENEVLLEEAKEIKEAIIKRIKKTIEN